MNSGLCLVQFGELLLCCHGRVARGNYSRTSTTTSPFGVDTTLGTSQARKMRAPLATQGRLSLHVQSRLSPVWGSPPVLLEGLSLLLFCSRGS